MWRELFRSFFAACRNVPQGRPRMPRHRPARLHFQALESRLLLSADVIGGVLEITGTDRADSLEIRQLDPPPGTAPRIEVVLNGQSFDFELEGIRLVEAKLLGGNDLTSIYAELGDEFTGAHYAINGGEGDNQTVLRFGDGMTGARLPTDPARVAVEYRSGAGNDRVTFEWLALVDCDAVIAPNEDPGARPLLDVSIDLGEGDNAFDGVFVDPQGALDVRSGAGIDSFTTEHRWTASGANDHPDFAWLPTYNSGGGDDHIESNVFAIWLTTGIFELNSGDGDDVVELNVVGEVAADATRFHRPNSFQIISAGGDDRIDAAFAGALGTIDFAADTGDGDDVVNTRYVGSANGGVWKTTNGGGADTVAHELTHVMQASPTTEQTRQLTVIHDMGSGDDVLDFVIDSPLLDEIQRDGIGFVYAADLGDGNDRARGRLSNPAPTQGGSEPEEPSTTRERPALSISGGGGDDAIALLLPAVQKVREAAARVQGGEGLDALSVETGSDGARVAAFFKSIGGLASEQEGVEYRLDVKALGSAAAAASVDVGGLEKVMLQTGSGDDLIDVNLSAAADIVTGAGDSAGPHVKVFSGVSAAESASFLAYPPTFQGGVRVASGDVNGDGFADVITGAGAGGGPHVKVFDGRTGVQILSFLAYDPAFTGGVFVAAGDINGDGIDDIVTGAGAGGPAHVKVFDGRNGALLKSFNAYDGFTGGVRVATGDVNGDGVVDIVTGTGPGAAAHVKVFDGLTLEDRRSFFAYGTGFTGGVYVAAGDFDGDGAADIVTGAGAGGGPHVKVFDGGTGEQERSFFAYDASFQGGVRVAAGDVNGDGRVDIITGTGPGAPAQVKVYDWQKVQEIRSGAPYGGFTGGVYVAAGDVSGDSVGRDENFTLGIDAGAGNDSAHASVNTKYNPYITVDYLAGTGADSVAVSWYDTSVNELPAVQSSLNVRLGGPDTAGTPEAGDQVLIAFEHGDFNRPVVIGALWNSQDRPGDEKSLRLDIVRSRGITDLSMQLRGGSGEDSVRLDVSGETLASLRLRASIELGHGDDEAVIDLSALLVEGAPTESPLDLTVAGGAGDDALILKETRVPGAFVAAQLIGGAGNDLLVAGPGDDLLNGGPGNDVLLGGNGDDRLLGGPGDDLLDGGPGNDELIGGPGNDVLVDGRGKDANKRGRGNDSIIGISALGIVMGGSGRDAVAPVPEPRSAQGARAGANPVIDWSGRWSSRR
jgi:hypothetical protein